MVPLLDSKYLHWCRKVSSPMQEMQCQCSELENGNPTELVGKRTPRCYPIPVVTKHGTYQHPQSVAMYGADVILIQ
jgi:hypothetical protein